MSETGIRDAGELDGFDPFAGADLVALAPISASQREIWLACEMDPELSVGYNEGLMLRLDGPLDVGALRDSLRALLARHEALRMEFSPNGKWLAIRREVSLELPIEEVASEHALQATCRSAMSEAMPLTAAPLLRLRLLRLSEQRHRLLFIAHHIVCDGWSGALLLSELAAFYSARIEGRAAALDDAPRYTDYAERERLWLASSEGQRHRQYWLTQLDPPPAVLSLPTDRPRQFPRQLGADRVDLRFPAALIGRLRKLGAEHGASLVATLLTGFSALLQRLTHSDDMVIGLAAAGQALHQVNGLVGHCVNLLPLRLRPTAQQSFSELLRHTRTTVLDAFDHQGLSFGSLIEDLKLVRDPSRPTLIPVVFNVDVRDDDLSHSGLSVSYDTLVRQAENFELYINLVDNGQDLLVEASYATALFDAGTIALWLHQFQQLLETACEAPQTLISELRLSTEQQIDSLRSRSIGKEIVRPDLSLWEMFEQQALSTPDAVALRCDDQQLSYAELHSQARDIGGALSALGMGPGDYVGVCLDRQLRLPAALLGVLACGAGYLPMDPDLPRHRLRLIHDDARAGYVVTDRNSLTSLEPEIELLLLEELATTGRGPLHRPNPARDPAYAIYTSGSTGQPKGVAISHRNVINTLMAAAEWLRVGPGDTVAALATISFDASVLEIFLPLTRGATLLIATREQTQDGTQLANLIDQHAVSHLFAAPSAWRLLLGAGWQGRPELLAASWAEPLPRDLARSLLSRVGQLWNLYGPTETTVITAGTRVFSAEAPITIGKPLHNTQCWIVDEHGNLQPPGVTGELWIGGAGVALGYIGKDLLTAEKFIANPFTGHGRLYRSGDLARWTSDGAIECLGRADSQIKLRGYRIEPGEIESLLREIPGVNQACCGLVEREPGDLRLCAWLVASASAASPPASELRRELRKRLPVYMIPQHFMYIDSMPLLVNGKLNRRALPDPFHEERQQAQASGAPRTLVEQRLAAIWQQVLGHRDFGIQDRFLDVGGHSVLAVEVLGQIEQQFAQRPTLRLLMMEPLARIAVELVANDPTLAEEPPVAQPEAPATVAVVAVARKPRRWWQRWLSG